LLLVNNGCDNKPSADDFAVARKTMPTSEVLFKIRAGFRKEEVLSEVLRRKTPTKIVSATELELAAFGAGPRLIAALKDDNNILTKAKSRRMANWKRLSKAKLFPRQASGHA
jgi:hypothetical protein